MIQPRPLISKLIVIVFLTLCLTGCETLQLKVKGGNRSGVDWGVGVRF